MARHGDFFSRWKQRLLETVIFIIFIVSLIEFLWYKIGTFVFKFSG